MSINIQHALQVGLATAAVTEQAASVQVPGQFAETLGMTWDQLMTLFQSDGVTPNVLMGLLGNKVSQYDQEIQGYMTQMKEGSKKAEEYQAKVTAARELESQLANIETEENGAVLVSEIELSKLSVPGQDGERRAPTSIEEFYEKNGITFAPGTDADGNRTVTRDSLTASIASLESSQRAENSSIELVMMQMQTAMQQRSQAISMVSNMIKSIQDTQKAIVGNMR